MSKRVTLPEVFYTHRFKTKGESDEVWVELSPMLADYNCIMQYDSAGNANVTIKRKSDNMVMLDMSLDNGEINVMELE